MTRWFLPSRTRLQTWCRRACVAISSALCGLATAAWIASYYHFSHYEFGPLVEGMGNGSQTIVSSMDGIFGLGQMRSRNNGSGIPKPDECINMPRLTNLYGFQYLHTAGPGDPIVNGAPSTWASWWLGVPYWSLVLLGGLYPAVVVRRVVLVRWRQSQHQCPTCGYDLRASGTVCPECGHANQLVG